MQTNMNYNPQTATPEEKWAFRMLQLGEYLKEIPFTTNQRTMINHHLNELGEIFKEAAPSVTIDHTRNPLS
jgi:hypothetical protein